MYESRIGCVSRRGLKQWMCYSLTWSLETDSLLGRSVYQLISQLIKPLLISSASEPGKCIGRLESHKSVPGSGKRNSSCKGICNVNGQLIDDRFWEQNLFEGL